MSRHPSATELVTAATNVPLAVTALTALRTLWQRRRAHPLRAGLWIAMFGGLAVASGLGVLAHGLSWEAALLQATRVVTLVPSLPLDHNGIFHLVQLPGLWCLRAGLNKALGSEPPDASYAPQRSLSLQSGP